MRGFLKSALKALICPAIDFAYKIPFLRKFFRWSVHESARQRLIQFAHRSRPPQPEIRPQTSEVSENAEWILHVPEIRPQTSEVSENAERILHVPEIRPQTSEVSENAEWILHVLHRRTWPQTSEVSENAEWILHVLDRRTRSPRHA
jgi:hypothetical protein